MRRVQGSYLFVYGERVLGVTPLQLALIVLTAGPVGLMGILLGRWSADRFGHRISGALAMAGAGVAVAIAYSGGSAALVVGYRATVLLASAFAPAQVSLAAELVPTTVRSTVAGWLTVTAVVGGVVGLSMFGVLAESPGTSPPPLDCSAGSLPCQRSDSPRSRKPEVPNSKPSKRTRHGAGCEARRGEATDQFSPSDSRAFSTAPLSQSTPLDSHP